MFTTVAYNNISYSQCIDKSHTGSHRSELLSDTILQDKNSKGKDRPWRDKKLSNINYAELLKLLEFKKADRVKYCAEILEFKQDQESEKIKLYKAWFCKSRLCALCNWRRTMKHSVQSIKIVEEVRNRVPTARWLFMTLSVKNVYDGEELAESLRDLSKGFNRLIKYKKVSKNLLGFMRATEVTVNPVDGSYNQHMHVLLCVKSTYFRSSDNYISHAELTGLWKRAMKLNYNPIVDIRAIRKKNRQTTDVHSAISEVAKYPVKDTDFMTGDAELDKKRVNDLEIGLRGKRMISYGGLLKTVHKELNLDDLEDGDLVHVDDDEKSEDSAYSIIAMWNWDRQNYYLKKER